jgi:hypothetical protein
VIECVPAVNVEVLYAAEPLLIVPVPSATLPSMNATVPVAVDGTTVPVNVTRPPTVAGFDDEASVTDDEDCPTTISARAMHPKTTIRKRDIARITVLSAWSYESFDKIGYRYIEWDFRKRVQVTYGSSPTRNG